MSNVVLLTGATGFVGRQILQTLVEKNFSLRLVVREGTELTLPESAKLDNVIRTKDLFIESSDWWAEVCKGVDTVIHCAWYAEPGKYLQSPLNIDCLIGTLNLAKGVVTAGVRKFVGVGTCFEYDLSRGVLSTETPLKPLTSYAAAKAAAFFELSLYFSCENVEFSWCRLFYLYGEGEDSRRLVPYLRQQLSAGKPADLTSGTQIRDFLDTREAGAMIVQVALSNYVGAVNICSGVPITVRQLAERVADEYGRRDLLNFGSRPDNLTDPQCVLGIKTIVSM